MTGLFAAVGRSRTTSRRGNMRRKSSHKRDRSVPKLDFKATGEVRGGWCRG